MYLYWLPASHAILNYQVLSDIPSVAYGNEPQTIYRSQARQN